ncbi:MAG TPA: sigma-54 dependent transcriptional regulator [Kofleriaceae bacterium]|nr:sigma-54 dependent transcriptional regulator [Kofleriaceae bacterium]
MKRLYEVARQVASSDVTVLIRGETGVGKELVAEALHRHSQRSRAAFLRINAASISESLVESELFGHQRGAFTGASSDRAGLFESAQGGTVFLDEIGELSAAVQAKLLRVLEDRQVVRVGTARPRALDVRFVVATHRDLEAAVAAGTFREDLYYRLAAIVLHVPPLRDRIEDIVPLARALIAEAAGRARKPIPAVADGVWGLLESYSWPGNVRELRNVVERAVLLAGERIDCEHLPIEKLTSVRPVPDPRPPEGSLRRVRSHLERHHIVDALARCGGNQTEAAKLLGVSRRTLSTKLDALDIARPRKRAEIVIRAV